MEDLKLRHREIARKIVDAFKQNNISQAKYQLGRLVTLEKVLDLSLRI